jgi:hypothetical protein
VIQAAVVMAEERVGGTLRPNAYGELAFVDEDPTRPNPAYWENVDYVVSRAEAHGLVLGLLPSFISWSGDGFKYLNVFNAYAYGKFLGERYAKKPHVIWLLGGDNTPGSEAKRRVWALVAKGITEGVTESEDYTKTLMTYHINGVNSSSQWLHRAPWLDFNMIQTWSDFWRIHPLIATDYNLPPQKPTGLGEGAYEDGPQYPTKPINAYVVRKQAYWSYMAGGYHTYGNTNTWNFGSYKDEATQDWKAALNSPGATHLTVLKNIFASIPWWKFVPDQSVFASGVGSGGTLNAAIRSTERDSILAYLSSPSTVSIRLSVLTAGQTVRASWIDPQTGARTSIGEYRTTETPSFTTPQGWEDALLLLEAQKGK